MPNTEKRKIGWLSHYFRLYNPADEKLPIDQQIAREKPIYYRFIGVTKFGNEVIDDSVQKKRREDSTYTPQNPFQS